MESLGVENNFIFCHIFQDESLLKELIQLILPDESISDLRIDVEKTVEVGMDSHGVRFDVFAVDRDGPAFTVEMQVANKYNLPKRIRYYQSFVDAHLLKKNEDYGKIRDSYVIMICPFDMFGMGLHKYTFSYRCAEEHDLELDDGTMAIVLNSVSTANDVSDGMRAFLDYVNGNMSDDDFVRRVDMAVQEAKMDALLRRDYMIRRQNALIEKRIAREEGLAEGRAEGREAGLVEGRTEGRNELATAIHMLKSGKTPDEIREEGIAQEVIDMAKDCL